MAASSRSLDVRVTVGNDDPAAQDDVPARRLRDLVDRLQGRLRPGLGRRPGRPTDDRWKRHPKIPISPLTEQRLRWLAESASREGRRVSPMQVAAQLLEDALRQLRED